MITMAIRCVAGGNSRLLRWSLFLLLAAIETASAQCPIQLSDVTKDTGISFRHTDGSSGQRYIVETVTAGLALFDYDMDGLIDIYFLNGTPLRATQAETAPTNILYRNLGNWKFADVTEQARVGDRGFGLGVAVGDYDNDGDPDIFVNNYGPNVLYRNNGDGTFDNVTKEVGLGTDDFVGAGAAFLDIEGDGDLDLYVANYVAFTYENHVVRSVDGFPEYAGPKDYAPVPDRLYRNNGNGTFTDVSEASGITAHAGTGMGMVCCDYDQDGDTDIFVLNDVAGNFFFVNDGHGKFEESGLFVGAAYNVHGHELGSMGLECADYDNDGWLDFFMTSYDNEMPALYRNLGDGYLEDVTFLVGAGQGARPSVNWGAGLVDFDNDGDRDLFMACGHLQDNIDSYDDTTSYHARNILLMNSGEDHFVNVSDAAGDGMSVKLSSRGAAFDDLDNDGDVDVVILNSRREPTLLRNDSLNENHWLQIQLRGTEGNRDGVGARVRVLAGDLVLVDEVHSGRSYQSHYGTRLQFGLGEQDRVGRIEVNWIGGGSDVLRDVAADQLLTIEQGCSPAE